MRPVLLALLLVTAPLAGCMGGGSDDEAPEPDHDTFDPAALPPRPTDRDDGGNPGDAERDASPDGDAEDDASTDESDDLQETPVIAYRPRVIVGVPDTGVNPYHELYYRPDLTAHPCTYIEGFPCEVRELPLTVGGDDWGAALDADRDVLMRMEPGEWYWIPRTALVAVSCESASREDPCLLGSHPHGTMTTSSVMMENPRALLAFKAGGPYHGAFAAAGIPVDVYSVSWGSNLPHPVPWGLRDTPYADAPLYVLSAGNDPRSTLLDDWAGHPGVISVGGAYAESGTEESRAARHADVVSYYCRPVAHDSSVTRTGDACGTSFAAPTVAGALSKVILGLREESGYTGGLRDEHVDPRRGVTIADLRDAMNRTASYDPAVKYPNDGEMNVPLNPAAPWLQWGWGFYDGLVADATLAHLLGTQQAREKPEAAHAYMDAQHTVKRLLYGNALG